MHSFDLFGEPQKARHGSTLAIEWDYPPFSVWSARDGWWQDRKREWLALGIASELGRGGGEKLVMSETIQRLKPGADPTAKRSGGGRADVGRPAASNGKRLKLLPQATPGGSLMPACDYKSRQRGDGRGRAI